MSDLAAVATMTPERLTLAIDAMWVLFSAFLVFFMQAGFSLLEGGSVRAKNVNSILIKNLVDAALTSVVFFCVGYGVAFGEDNGTGFMGTNRFFAGSRDGSFWVFQMAFAATAATIVSGCIAERTSYIAYFAFSMVVSGWVYPCVAHWVWGTGWLSSTDAVGGQFIDFAGSGVVHCVGGLAGLIGAWIVGPRVAYETVSSETKQLRVTGALRAELARMVEGTERRAHQVAFNPVDKFTYVFPATEGDEVMTADDLLDTQAGKETLEQLEMWAKFVDDTYAALAPRMVKVVSLVLNTGVPLADVPMDALVEGQLTVEVLLDRFYEIEMEEKNVPLAPGRREHIVHRVNEHHFQGSSMTNATLGVFILWFGWFGFNCGSTLSITGEGQPQVASLVAMNTLLAPAAATLSALFFMKFYIGVVALDDVLNSLLAGLVSITASCAVVGPGIAVLVGTIGGMLYLAASHVIANRLRIDDPVNASAVHFVNGCWGVIAVSLADDELVAKAGYTVQQGQVWVQLYGLVAIVAWTGLWTLACFSLLQWLGKLRVTQFKESRGFDEEYSLEYKMNVHAARSAVTASADKGAQAVASGSAHVAAALDAAGTEDERKEALAAELTDAQHEYMDADAAYESDPAPPGGSGEHSLDSREHDHAAGAAAAVAAVAAGAAGGGPSKRVNGSGSGGGSAHSGGSLGSGGGGGARGAGSNGGVELTQRHGRTGVGAASSSAASREASPTRDGHLDKELMSSREKIQAIRATKVSAKGSTKSSAGSLVSRSRAGTQRSVGAADDRERETPRSATTGYGGMGRALAAEE